jgi:hypothetical protein
MNINFKNVYKHLGLIQRSVRQADFLAIDFESINVEEVDPPKISSSFKNVDSKGPADLQRLGKDNAKKHPGPIWTDLRPKETER